MAGPDLHDIRGAIFDMDGTLLDSMSVWETLGADYLRTQGIEPRPGLREQIRNMSMREVARYYQSAYGLHLSEIQIISGINALLMRFYRDQAALKPGAAALLKTLAGRGVRMCVATATDRPLVEAALKRTGIRGYFEEIFTCSETGCGKDRPYIYETAWTRLGTPRAATWVFEDALYAVKTARAAGFPVVGVFDRYERRTAEAARLSSIYVQSLTELEAYFI